MTPVAVERAGDFLNHVEWKCHFSRVCVAVTVAVVRIRKDTESSLIIH